MNQQKHLPMLCIWLQPQLLFLFLFHLTTVSTPVKISPLMPRAAIFSSSDFGETTRSRSSYPSGIVSNTFMLPSGKESTVTFPFLDRITSYSHRVFWGKPSVLLSPILSLCITALLEKEALLKWNLHGTICCLPFKSQITVLESCWPGFKFWLYHLILERLEGSLTYPLSIDF